MDLLNVYDVDFCGKSSRLLTVKDTLKTFDDFKNKEKSAFFGKHLPGTGGGPAIFAQHFCFYNTVIFC